jgi:hypothetical protein
MIQKYLLNFIETTDKTNTVIYKIYNKNLKKNTIVIKMHYKMKNTHLQSFPCFMLEFQKVLFFGFRHYPYGMFQR